MRKFFNKKQKKRQVQKVLFSLPMFVVLGGITVSMAVSVWNIKEKAQITQNNLQKITETYEELYAREVELAASVKTLRTSFGVESEIRDMYGLVKEGEEVIVIVDEKNKKEENDEIETEIQESLWSRVLKIF
ncbi:MAG: septum formation initiator family protein [Candidatus Pacebacteria bacterium]|nr:septum formation initiator family protein [Candidatus Paceibacterota bacterium]